MNADLKADKTIDDSMSGTTAIMLLINKGSIHVANVGDSRAIVAQMRDSHLTAYSLSQDQTPFRKDERERCKRAGAQVATMDQLEGLEDMHENWGDNAETGGDEGDGDPPRIWIPGQMYPGCAFTRSIGDATGEKVGVFAEPELLNKQLLANDKFIILASDGVWEFMTNQMVVDMVQEFKSPLKACKAVVQEAYKLWLQFDVRTDDITMTLILLEETEGLEAAFYEEQARLAKLLAETKKDAEGGAAGGAAGGRRPSCCAALRRQSTAALAVTAAQKLQLAGREAYKRQSAVGISLGAQSVEGEQVKPVRRVMTKQKRQVVQGQSEDMDVSGGDKKESGWTMEVSEAAIPEAERAEIKKAVATNFLLAHLNQEQQAVVFAKMQTCTTKKGQTVIEKGQPGDWFYVVASGTYDVVIGGVTVFTYAMEEEGDAHPSFGELALLYSKPRAASIACGGDGKLWRLHRTTFREVVMKSSAQQLTKTLRGVEVLKFLTISQLQRLQDSLSESTVPEGKTVIAQGEPGKEFYIIMEGDAAVTIKDGDSTREVMKLKQYDYFGERALLNDAPRAASVAAKTPMRLLSISKSLFEEVLGPLEQIMNEHRKQREARAHHNYLQRQAEGLLDVQPDEFEPMKKVATAAHQDIYVVVRKIDKTDADKAATDAAKAAGGKAEEVNTRLSSLGTVYDKGEVIEQRFSVRCFPKKKVVDAQMQKRVIAEMQLLGQMPPNPFVPILLASFSDKHRLFAVLGSVLVTDLATVTEGNPVAEEAAKFYVAGVFRALHCVHEAEVVCRACTLDAVMLDNRGYPQLVDFALSKSVSNGRTHTLCGVADYLAPEQVKMSGHGVEADYWALGVFAFELMAGHSPWNPKKEEISEMNIYKAITDYGGGDDAVKLPFPAEMTDDARTMIEELMEPDVSSRLGCMGAGADDIVDRTPWFETFPWAALEQRLEPDEGAAAKKKTWNLFREACEKLSHAAYTPDGSSTEEVAFDAPDYHGDNRWCEDWDFTCTAGSTVEDSRQKEKDQKEKGSKKNSITHGSL